MPPSTGRGYPAMLRSLGLLIVLLLGSLSGRATHIVGGQLGMKRLSSTTYELKLTLYFDAVNGSPGAQDPTVDVAIYPRGDTSRLALMDVFTLPLVSTTPVPYTSPQCQISQLSTDELVYRQVVSLNPLTYNDPGGYYMVWERCCRNNIITNIVAPGATGQTFYLEFPPLMRSGMPFANSSPEVFQPVSVYACAGVTFSYPFGGVDPDGDSLVYELGVPLSGHSSSANVVPSPPFPAPYRRVQWLPSFDSLNQITGSQPLRVHPRTGEISFTAGQPGLYVFSVVCHEYRAGVRIGQVRREFQQLVITCPPTQTPALALTPPGQTTPYVPGTLLVLSSTTAPCLRLYATDPDPNTRLRLKVVPVSFPGLPPNLSVTTGTINTPGQPDTLFSQLCFPACYSTNGQTASLDLIVEDDACPLPRRDTVRLAVRVDPPLNRAPGLTLTHPGPPRQSAPYTPGTVLTVSSATAATLNLYATDPDPDTQLTLRLLPTSPAAPPLSLTVTNGLANPGGRGDTVFSRLEIPPCYTTNGQPAHLRFVVEDSHCAGARTDTVEMLLVVEPPAPAIPMLRLIPAQASYEVRAGDSVDFQIRGTVTTQDLVTTQALGLQADPLAGLGISCPTVQGSGEATTRLLWPIGCDVVPGTYDLRLRVSAANLCGDVALTDSTVRVTVLPPELTPILPPNVFTPNSDGLNDTFTPTAGPLARCNPEFRQLRVFNRWGREVFASPDRTAAWDGGGLSEGMYFYFLEYADRTYKGWVELIR